MLAALVLPFNGTREFQREQAEPPASPGYQKDHIKPCALAGQTRFGNLQWRTVRDAAVKDRWERRVCGRRLDRRVSSLANDAAATVVALGITRSRPLAE